MLDGLVRSGRLRVEACADCLHEGTRTGRADAAFAITMLGNKALRHVPTETLLHFGQWLGWPDWLRDGTSLTNAGPLPATISLVDGLTMIGNNVDQADSLALVERIFTSPRPVMGPVAALQLLHASDMGQELDDLVQAWPGRTPG